jgi:hypothetical protein
MKILQRVLQEMKQFDKLFKDASIDHKNFIENLANINYDYGYRVPRIHAEQLAALLERGQEAITRAEVLDLFLSFHGRALKDIRMGQREWRIRRELQAIGRGAGFKVLADSSQIRLRKIIGEWNLSLEYTLREDWEGDHFQNYYVLRFSLAQEGEAGEPFDIATLLEHEAVFQQLCQIRQGCRIPISFEGYGMEKTWYYAEVPRSTGTLSGNLSALLTADTDLQPFKTEELLKLLTFEVRHSIEKLVKPSLREEYTTLNLMTLRKGLLEYAVILPPFEAWFELVQALQCCVDLY